MAKINDPAKIREKARQKGQKRKRNEVEKIQADVSRKTKLDELIANGNVDARTLGKECPRCSKLYFKLEEYTADIILKDNETLCGFFRDKRRNRINWQSPCLSCGSEMKKKSHVEGTGSFNHAQIGTLKRHLAMTPDELRIALNQLREQFGGKCAACGIQTIRRGKSGFRQESFTDMYPKKRTHEDPSCRIEDMRLVCLACQFFQHRSNWNNEFKDSFIEIQQAPHKSKNSSPLNDDELTYF